MRVGGRVGRRESRIKIKWNLLEVWSQRAENHSRSYNNVLIENIPELMKLVFGERFEILGGKFESDVPWLEFFFQANICFFHPKGLQNPKYQKGAMQTALWSVKIRKKFATLCAKKN